MPNLIIALALIFITAFIVGYFLVPAFYGFSLEANERRQRELSKNIEQLMSRQESEKISKLFILAPIVLSGLLVFFLPNLTLKLIGLVCGFFIGYVFPNYYIKYLKAKTKKMFNDQLVDALMILSSCLRAGLSLIQAFEAVVDEPR